MYTTASLQSVPLEERLAKMTQNIYNQMQTYQNSMLTYQFQQKTKRQKQQNRHKSIQVHSACQIQQGRTVVVPHRVLDLIEDMADYEVADEAIRRRIAERAEEKELLRQKRNLMLEKQEAKTVPLVNNRNFKPDWKFKQDLFQIQVQKNKLKAHIKHKDNLQCRKCKF